jgi:hypothetical protein
MAGTRPAMFVIPGSGLYARAVGYSFEVRPFGRPTTA